jgi:hypothetical protein
MGVIRTNGEEDGPAAKLAIESSNSSANTVSLRAKLLNLVGNAEAQN